MWRPAAGPCVPLCSPFLSPFLSSVSFRRALPCSCSVRGFFANQKEAGRELIRAARTMGPSDRPMNQWLARRSSSVVNRAEAAADSNDLIARELCRPGPESDGRRIRADFVGSRASRETTVNRLGCVLPYGTSPGHGYLSLVECQRRNQREKLFTVTDRRFCHSLVYVERSRANEHPANHFASPRRVFSFSFPASSSISRVGGWK